MHKYSITYQDPCNYTGMCNTHTTHWTDDLGRLWHQRHRLEIGHAATERPDLDWARTASGSICFSCAHREAHPWHDDGTQNEKFEIGT